MKKYSKITLFLSTAEIIIRQNMFDTTVNLDPKEIVLAEGSTYTSYIYDKHLAIIYRNQERQYFEIKLKVIF